MKLYYPALVYDVEDGSINLMMPDFPDCFAGGPTLEQAVKSAEGVMGLYLRRNNGKKPAPRASKLDQINFPECGASAIILIGLDDPNRVGRYNVMLPVDLVAQIDAACDNRSAFLAQAAQEKLARASQI